MMPLAHLPIWFVREWKLTDKDLAGVRPATHEPEHFEAPAHVIVVRFDKTDRNAR
jgi:hypothetical protein